MKQELVGMGTLVAPVLDEIETGAILGRYEKALDSTVIKDTRSKLVDEDAKARFDKIMELFRRSSTHGLRPMIFPLADRYFPAETFGENSNVLFLLMLGAGSQKTKAALDSLCLSYEQQLLAFAKKHNKDQDQLTVVDLGEAIIGGEFLPEEF